MSTPYLVGVWQPSLVAVAQFINKHRFADHLVQIFKDEDMQGGYWAMLRVTGDQKNAIKDFPSKPRLTVIP